MLRSLEQQNHLEVKITSYGQAVAVTDDAQRSYTFPNTNPAENVEYVLGQANDKVTQGNFFRPGAHAP